MVCACEAVDLGEGLDLLVNSSVGLGCVGVEMFWYET